LNNQRMRLRILYNIAGNLANSTQINISSL
jgi:hypothetical protein